MRQQQFEDALRAIVKRIETTGPTVTHDTYGDRKKANAALMDVLKIARETLSK